MITINEKSITFDQPVVIDGKSYSEFEWDKAKNISALDINKAERFAKEQLFRQNGYVRVRLDGKPANKLEQAKEEYVDYLYADIAFPNYKFWPTEKNIIDNEEIEVCGFKTKTSIAISQIYNSEKFSTVQERITKDVALRVKILAEFVPVVTTPQVVQEQGTIKQEDSKAKKAKLNPIIQQTPQTTQNSQPTTEQPVAEATSTEKVQQTLNWQYATQDRVNGEPFKSNPVLVQIASKIETEDIKMNAYFDDVGFIWCPIFEKGKYNEEKSFVVDLNGVLIDNAPKVFLMKQFHKYADRCKYQIISEGTIEAVVKNGKLPKMPKDKLDVIDATLAFNNVVDLSSITKANIPDTVKASIMTDLYKRSEELNELFKMNGRIRMRLKSANNDGGYTLMIGPDSKNGIYAKPVGPSCPPVNYVVSPGQEIVAQIDLTAA